MVALSNVNIPPENSQISRKPSADLFNHVSKGIWKTFQASPRVQICNNPLCHSKVREEFSEEEELAKAYQSCLASSSVMGDGRMGWRYFLEKLSLNFLEMGEMEEEAKRAVT